MKYILIFFAFLALPFLGCNNEPPTSPQEISVEKTEQVNSLNKSNQIIADFWSKSGQPITNKQAIILTNNYQHTIGRRQKIFIDKILLEKAIQDSYKRLILPSVETDVRVDLKMKADRAAVDVFAENLRNLLLASPLGERAVIGIDPGLRTGCKCAAVDATGKFLDTVTLYLCQGDQSLSAAKLHLLQFIEKHKPFAIGIGNGTGGRETEAFVDRKN